MKIFRPIRPCAYNTVCVRETVHEGHIRGVYSELVHKIRADKVAAYMYQHGALEETELNEIQYKCSHDKVSSAQYLLNIVIVRPPHVYESLLQALQTTNQHDAYLLLMTSVCLSVTFVVCGDIIVKK